MIIKKKIITVIGDEQPSSEEAKLAEEVGPLVDFVESANAATVA